MRKTLTALLEADVIISIGFSIPPSDIHIRALFDIVNQQDKQNKRVGLIYATSKDDKTYENWEQIFTPDKIKVISDKGLAVSSEKAIDEMWGEIFKTIEL